MRWKDDVQDLKDQLNNTVNVNWHMTMSMMTNWEMQEDEDAERWRWNKKSMRGWIRGEELERWKEQAFRVFIIK